MRKLTMTIDPRVEGVFDNYPSAVRPKIKNLRRLILEAAEKIESINDLEETLKWGEPSYLAKKGSTIRIDWKAKTPNQYAIYFKCTSRLVPTFKMIYSNLFHFEGNRAIIFQMEDVIPEKELKECISAALKYHSVKHLPKLGM